MLGPSITADAFYGKPDPGRGQLRAELTAGEESFLGEQLAHPDKYPSAILKCLKQEWPDLFKHSIEARQITAEVAGPTGPIRYRVLIGKRVVLFLFPRNNAVIHSIKFPDGSSLGVTVDRCVERARERGDGG